jgi:ethanolamine utilization protein EutN
MITAKVIGHATSTVKHPTLEQKKLLVVWPLMADGVNPDGPPMLAVDVLGAGIGDLVLLTSDGAAVRDLFGVENSPIRWATLGLIDPSLPGKA